MMLLPVGHGLAGRHLSARFGLWWLQFSGLVFSNAGLFALVADLVAWVAGLVASVSWYSRATTWNEAS